MVAVAAIQLSCYSTKALIDQTWKTKWAYVPIQFHLQKQTIGQSWPTGYILSVPHLFSYPVLWNLHMYVENPIWVHFRISTHSIFKTSVCKISKRHEMKKKKNSESLCACHLVSTIIRTKQILSWRLSSCILFNV